VREQDQRLGRLSRLYYFFLVAHFDSTKGNDVVKFHACRLVACSLCRHGAQETAPRIFSQRRRPKRSDKLVKSQEYFLKRSRRDVTTHHSGIQLEA
jgi:hypothetical protein